MSGIHFPITGDNSSFLNSLRGCEQGVSRTAKQIEQSGLSIEDMFSRMSKAASAFGVAFSAQQFTSQVMKVRGEFQQLEVAFNTMLGSAEKSEALMSQLTRTAAITPFGLQDVAGGAKQLLAYGVAAENVNDTLIRLGDIAAGLSIPLNDLVYLYGTTMTQGRMFTQDLRQFQGRGIPLADELAKQFGVTKDKVGELVTAGKVGFEEMHKAIVSMTSDGGKFGGLMEAQSKTITGQISNIEDAIDGMFNEIGKSSEGVINTALGGVSALVENYEKVGEAIAVVVGAYGIYKAALFTSIAVQKVEAAITEEAALQKGLAAMGGHTLSAAQARATTTSILFANAQRTVAASLKAVAASTLANPYVLAAAAIAAVVYGVYKLATAETAAERATRERNEELEKQNALMEENRQKAEDSINVIKDIVSTDLQRAEALSQLRSLYPKIFEQYDIETIKLADIAKIKGQIAEYDSNKVKEERETNIKKLDEQIAFLEKLQKKSKTIFQKDFVNTRLPNLEERRNVLLAERGAEISEQFISSLKNYDTDTIDKYVKYLEGKIRNVGKDSYIKMALPIDIKGNLSAEAVYKVQDIQNLIDVAESRKKSLGEEKPKYQAELAKAKADWEREKKEYEAIRKDRNATVEQFEKAKQELEDAEDKYEKLGGDTKGQEQKAADKAANEQAKRDKELLSMRRANQQTEIDLLEDGAEKRLKQIELNWQKEKDAIEEQRKKWENAQKGTLTAEQQGVLDGRSLFADKTKANEEAKVYKELTDKYQSYANERIEIEKQYNKDIEALETIRKSAEEKGDTDLVKNITESIAKATSDKGKALMSHDLNVLKQSPEYIRAFEDLGNTSTETLQRLMAELEALKSIAAESFDTENMKEYADVMQNISDVLMERQGAFDFLSTAQSELANATEEVKKYQDIVSRIKNGEKVVKDEDTGAFYELEEATNLLNQATDNQTKSQNKYKKAVDATKAEIDELASAIAGLGDTIGGTSGRIISLVGDTLSFMSTTMDGITKVAATGAQAISTVEKASVILGIISAAIQLLQKISDLGSNKQFKEYEAYAKKVQEINAITDAVNAYKLAVIEARNEEEHWFGSSSLQGLKNAKETHEQIAKNYEDAIKEQQAVYRNESGGGWLTGAVNWAMANMSALSFSEDWRNIWGQGDYNKGTTEAINNLRIETRKASSGFLGTGIGSKSQKTEDLREWVRSQGMGELFDENNLINKELAQAVLDEFGGKLVGETKETLEELIELREKYDEWQEQLREYVNSMYEPLVDNFVDSLWAWYDEGVDALDAFKDYASETFRDITSDILESLVQTYVIKSFGDDISDLYNQYAEGKMTEDELMRNVTQLTSDVMDRYEAQLPVLQGLITNVSDSLESIGIDMSDTSSSSSSASRGTIESMNQDTADELNGRFTALQMAGEEIKNQMIAAVIAVNNLSVTSTEGNSILKNILEQHAISNGYLDDLVAYAKNMVSFGDKLDNIVSNTQNL